VLRVNIIRECFHLERCRAEQHHNTNSSRTL